MSNPQTKKWWDEYCSLHWLLAPILIPIFLIGFVAGLLFDYLALGFSIGMKTR